MNKNDFKNTKTTLDMDEKDNNKTNGVMPGRFSISGSSGSRNK